MKEISLELLEKVIVERSRHSHKGDYGRLLLIGGTYPYGGAIIMAALASVRSGAGLVTVATDKENIPPLHSHLPEAMAFDLDDKQLLEQQLKKASVVLVGSGLVDDERGEELLHTVFHHLEQNQTLILDGGALSILAKTKMKFPKVHLVLTPHQREWQVLSGLDLTSQGTEETGKALKRFPSGTILVQKGPATRIWQAGQADCYQLSVGGPYQATGGMGDTLAGMVAGFAGQFPQASLYERVTVATHLHSAIAQELAEDNYVVLPTMISQQIPAFMKNIQKDT
ncbi:NAD(P)H-hydrate dehydratase [Streptococcus sp. Marseille-Q0941]|uniref:NAD(P)H-hydrate dehydratase n=1 Tax=Streptococcus sp. Marseille-Q0941 TaxID=2942206 RepID=UPI002072C721|nr:NAD(P)H-hydrate dehydratase [Streptococcus sp. Marseille-Q0941]